MTRVDLITGFLGAGKTTFIRRYLRHLADQRVLLIENEYGSIGVDSQFLRGEACEIEDLAGVCMCCRGRDQFIDLLLGAARDGYDRVLVEPSGVYDVDEFFGVMALPALRETCEIGCVLTVVDASIPERLSPESEYLMFTQLAAAGTVLLSRTQGRSEAELRATVQWLEALCRDYSGAGEALLNLCAKPWDALTEEDYRLLMDSGCCQDSHERKKLDHEAIYASWITAGRCLDAADLAQRLRLLMFSEASRFGDVIRAKGYVRDLNGNWYQVNCTRDEISVSPAPGVKRGVLVVIGQGLREEALETVLLPRT